jgi:hypothetical protein
MCEDFVYFEQLMPYIWKKVHDDNCENNCVLNLINVEPLGGAHINLLYIFFEFNFNLPYL